MAQTNTIKKASTVIITVYAKGQGLVNYAGKDDQKAIRWAANAEPGSTIGVTKNNNVKYGKANFYMKDGKIVMVPKISSNKVRALIFGLGSNTCPMPDDTSFLYTRTSLVNLIRGYVDAGDKDCDKRKSAVYVSDAELTNGAIPQLETHTTYGTRNDTSMFSVETIGNAEWKFTVAINLSELAFISLSEVYDRLAVPHRLETQYVHMVGCNLGQDIKPASYVKKNGTGMVPETGLLMDDASITKCVNKVLSMVRGLDLCGSAMSKSEVHFDHMDVQVRCGDGSIVDVGDATELNLSECAVEYEQVDDSKGIEQAYLKKAEGDKIAKEQKEAEKKAQAAAKREADKAAKAKDKTAKAN